MSRKQLMIAGGMVLVVVVTGIFFVTQLRFGSPRYANLADQCYSLKIGDQAEPFQLKVLLVQARQAYPALEAFDHKRTEPMLAEFKANRFGRGERDRLCSPLEEAVNAYGVPR
jgi:hypothetical protein